MCIVIKDNLGVTNNLTGLYNPLPSAAFTAVGHTHTATHNSIKVAVKLITGSQSTVRGELLMSLQKNKIINMYANGLSKQSLFNISQIINMQPGLKIMASQQTMCSQTGALTSPMFILLVMLTGQVGWSL